MKPTRNPQKKLNLSQLIAEALSFTKSYYGITAQYPAPAIIIDQRPSPAYIHNTNAIHLLSDYKDREQAFAIGEEASHYWHRWENPSLNEELLELQKIIAEHSRTDKSPEEKMKIVARWISIRTLQELVGCLGGIGFTAHNKGDIQKIFRAINSMKLEDSPTGTEIIDHYLGYKLAPEAYHTFTPQQRNKLLHIQSTSEIPELLAGGTR